MKRLYLLAACGLGLLSVRGQAAQPINLNVRTVGDLANLCSAEPASAGADAKLNFCRGFAQGAVEAWQRQGGEKKPFCFPNPAPTRTATMKEFIGWARASPGNLEQPATDGLFKFMGERFPCKG